ncbi:MAG: thymidine phosphorylase [Candidatus Acidiferrales bacterium]
MRVVDLIRKKRDGGELSREEIAYLVAGAARNTIPDYQLAAWLMAVVCRGVTRAETAFLTDAMLHSGEVMDFSDLRGPKVDKHSTGGVGDKTSLIVAPIVAAAGSRAPADVPVYVPMLSGRGLGHTGGTLDKLESIPGFRVDLSKQEFRDALAACGCALSGATPEIAPADKRLYALRDVTATVESPGLICASIMCKKLAEGIDALVFDVKTGDGAFMKNEKDAVALAELLVETGTRIGKRVVALITDMDQPLGHNIGNALEVEECLQVLNGQGPADLRSLSIELSARMLFLAGGATDVASGKQLAEEMIATGRARDKFREVVAQQSGDAGVVDDPTRLPQARKTEALRSARAGFISRIACEQVGTACVILGGGREKQDDRIDSAVGIVLGKKVGDTVRAGEALCTVHYNADSRLREALDLLEKSFVIADEPLPQRPLILRTIGS